MTGVQTCALPLSGPAAQVKSEVVHVRAVTTGVLGSGGVTIPQLFVLNGDGSVILEGKKGASQSIPPVIVALRKPAKPAKPGTPVKLPSISKLLADHGTRFRPGDRPIIVSLESGTTVGACTACTNYLPKLEAALRAMNTDVRWIRVNIERNDYKPVATK